MAEPTSPVKSSSKRSQRIENLLLNLQEEIDALQTENRVLRDRLAALEGREPAAAMRDLLTPTLEQQPFGSEHSGKASKSMSQRIQAAYQVLRVQLCRC